eukprot:gene13102-8948_t
MSSHGPSNLSKQSQQHSYQTKEYAKYYPQSNKTVTTKTSKHTVQSIKTQLIQVTFNHKRSQTLRTGMSTQHKHANLTDQLPHKPTGVILITKSTKQLPPYAPHTTINPHRSALRRAYEAAPDKRQDTVVTKIKNRKKPQTTPTKKTLSNKATQTVPATFSMQTITSIHNIVAQGSNSTNIQLRNQQYTTCTHTTHTANIHSYHTSLTNFQYQWQSTMLASTRKLSNKIHVPTALNKIAFAKHLQSHEPINIHQKHSMKASPNHNPNKKRTQHKGVNTGKHFKVNAINSLAESVSNSTRHTRLAKHPSKQTTKFSKPYASTQNTINSTPSQAPITQKTFEPASTHIKAFIITQSIIQTHKAPKFQPNTHIETHEVTPPHPKYHTR